MLQQAPLDPETPLLRWRAALLAAMLEESAFDGWTRAAMARAGEKAGLNPGQVEIAAPRGPIDLLNAFADWADQAMEASLSRTDLGAMKVRERVRFAVMARLEAMAPHQLAARRALAAWALPQHAPEAAQVVWRTADRIWRALADPSTDFNYYTKRAILVGVLVSTELVWASDEDPALAPTQRFLDRRIAAVMEIEKAKARLKPLAGLATQAAAFAGRLRYGRR